MTLVLDAGAFVAVERSDRTAIGFIKRELLERRVPITHGGVVGQVWRGGQGKQANVARLLRATEVRALDEDLGRRAGLLLVLARRADPIDAAVVLLAGDGDTILTSDPSDLRALAAAAGLDLDLVKV
jgi:hypothetical protein